MPQLSGGCEDPPLVTALPGHLLSISSALLPNPNGNGLQTRGMRGPLGVPCPPDQRASSSCSPPLAVSPPAAPGGLPTSPPHSPPALMPGTIRSPAWHRLPTAKYNKCFAKIQPTAYNSLWVWHRSGYLMGTKLRLRDLGESLQMAAAETRGRILNPQ